VPAREPKRIYSPSAIEKWFDRLCSPWEKSFDREELRVGRGLYRECHVRELQLDPETLIVHRRNGREDVYSVVEWENGAPSVRSGTTDKLEGRALAAAGLYEAEELIATEVSPLPPDDKRPEPPAPDISPPAKPVPEPEQGPPPHMRLRLSATTQGVRLCGFWIEEQNEKPAFGSLRGNEGDKIAPRHREMLIRLTGKAKHAGFVFRPGKSDFILRDALAIPSFVRRDLPRWRGIFDVEADPRLQVFSDGVRKVSIKAKAREIDGKGVGLDWSAWIDGEVLARSHAQTLLRRPGHIVISPELGLLRIDAGQSADLADLSTQGDDGAQVPIPYYMLFSMFQSETLPLELSPELAAWRDRVMGPPDEGLVDLPPTLREYQRRGVAWMRHLLANGCHCLLADEMGLGKTAQVLALLATTPAEGLPSLIVCPASVVPVWKAEAAKFFPHLRLEALSSNRNWEHCHEPIIWVSSYTQLRRHRHLVAQRQFAYAVLDEAQFIKNPDAKITQVCSSLKAQRRIAVTGTPVENRELDLWSIFRFLMPGLLGSRGRMEKLAATDPKTLRERLSRQVAPFILRRSKTEVASELPPKVESIMNCPLTQLQNSEYQRLAREGLASFGDDLNKSVQERTLPFFTLLTRLRQTCCDPGLLPWTDCNPRQSGKIIALLDKLHELVDHGRKAVVFSQFASLLHRVEKVVREDFPDLPVEMLTGSTTNREKPVSAFQNTEGAAIMLVSLKAGGTGITLSAAEYVFLLDPWWNPAVEAQAIDRVHRIGQDRTVFIYRLIASGTIEERIEKLKEQKRDLFDGTVGRLADMSRFSNYFSSLADLMGTGTPAESDEGPE
jgi:superfamily II DNA or RNA helicase